MSVVQLKDVQAPYPYLSDEVDEAFDALRQLEAEGRRFLVATSPEGAPAFYALDERRASRLPSAARQSARVSW